MIQSGPYRYVRHPMYSAVILFGVGSLSMFAYWKVLVLLFLIAILYIKARREERFWCEKTAEYRKYQEKTNMFIPYVL